MKADAIFKILNINRYLVHLSTFKLKVDYLIIPNHCRVSIRMAGKSSAVAACNLEILMNFINYIDSKLASIDLCDPEPDKQTIGS